MNISRTSYLYHNSIVKLIVSMNLFGDAAAILYCVVSVIMGCLGGKLIVIWKNRIQNGRCIAKKVHCIKWFGYLGNNGVQSCLKEKVTSES